MVGFPFLEHREDRLFDTTHARLAGLWAELDVPYLDLRPVFEGRPTGELSVNRYDSHPNPDAHRMAAAAIESFIEAETGAWTFTPTDPNWFGSDSFTVTVTDDLGGTTTQVVNITLANIDDPAIITGDISY